MVDMSLFGPHVKVWDGMCEKGKGAADRHSPFLTSFLQITYGAPWARVPVTVERDAEDPNQQRGIYFCGPMAALTLANLVKGSGLWATTTRMTPSCAHGCWPR